MPVRRLWQAATTLARRLDLALLIGALIVSCSAWAVIGLADEVVEGEAERFDTAVLLFFRDAAGEPAGPRWLQIAMRDVTALGGPVVLVLLLAALAGFLAMRRTWRALALVVAAPITGLLLSILLKSAMDRERPGIVRALMHETSTSFPSGHSMMSALVYLTLGALLARFARTRQLQIYCIGVALLLTLMIGVSRVYLGVHWPTDVLAGWCAGVAWAVICWFAARWLQRHGQVERTVTAPAGAQTGDD